MISYKEYGIGYPTLLVHGLGVSFPIWKDIIPILESKYRLIVIEQPGVGNSKGIFRKDYFFEDSINEIETLRKHLSIEKWNIISYSLGTKIIEKYLEKYSNLVNKNIYIFPLDPENYKIKILNLFLALDEKWPNIGNYILSGWRLYLICLGIGFNMIPKAETTLWYEELSKVSLSVLKNTIREAANACAKKLKIDDKNTFCIWGNIDTVSDSLVTKRPGIILNAGHNGIHNKETALTLEKVLGN